MLSRLSTVLFAITFASFAFGQGVQNGGNAGGGLGGAQGGLQGFGGVGQQGGGGPAGSISGILSDNSDIEGTGFLGRNANSTGFLSGAGTATGGRNAAAGGQFGNAGGFGAGGFGGGAGGFGNNNRGGQQPGGARSTRVVRTRITIPRDFGRVVIPASRIRSRLNTEYRRVSQLKNTLGAKSSVATSGLRGSSITATPNGESVTLSGTVRSERDRIIAEKMAKMEPGVRSVVNQLVVSSQQ